MIDSLEKTTLDDPAQQASGRPSVLISGATGMVGRALMRRLAEREQPATRLVRSHADPNDILWDPSSGQIASDSISAGAVVHLAGENIADGRWTKSKRRAIRDSRVRGTRLLAETLARLETPPKVLVSASAIGFYGDRGAEILTEDSPGGTGFLADVCQEWEASTQAAEDAGIRVVHLRIGVVLSREGGALRKMLTPFKLGAGGKVGRGDQYMSWVLLDDLVTMICTSIDDERLSGPVNATAPGSVTNKEFTETLGAVLRRPTLATMPAFLARVVFGGMADELLLASHRVQPRKLLDRGFEFEEPRLEGALRSALQSSRGKKA